MFVASFVASGESATAFAAVGDRRDKVGVRFKREVSCSIVFCSNYRPSNVLGWIEARRRPREARHGKIRVAWSREISTTCKLSSYDASRAAQCLLSVSDS